jgi:hypothetical protein
MISQFGCVARGPGSIFQLHPPVADWSTKLDVETRMALASPNQALACRKVVLTDVQGQAGALPQPII